MMVYKARKINRLAINKQEVRMVVIKGVEFTKEEIIEIEALDQEIIYRNIINLSGIKDALKLEIFCLEDEIKNVFPDTVGVLVEMDEISENGKDNKTTIKRDEVERNKAERIEKIREKKALLHGILIKIQRLIQHENNERIKEAISFYFQLYY